MSLPKSSLFSNCFIACLSVFLATATVGWGNVATHSVFLTESDVVMGMGNNEYGQLSVPVVRESSVPIQSKFGVREISSGGSHSVFLMWDGTVWAVGKNDVGQLGDGTSMNRSNPVQVVDGAGNPLSRVVAISAGESHSAYLIADGTVWAAGSNQYGRLGDGTNTNRSNPVQVVDGSGNPLSGITAISAGWEHTVYLKSDGTAWAAGMNGGGQLGDGTNVNRANPVQVVHFGGSPLTGLIGVSAGGAHSSYLKGDGTVWAVGANNTGQLGDGTTTHRSNPVMMIDNAGNKFDDIVQISTGGGHTICLKSDGTVWGVGNNLYGQLADGTNTNRSNPVQSVNAGGIPTSGVIKISAGIYNTSYMKGDGTVWASGYNYYGQLGDGTTTNRSNPVQVVDGSGNPLSGVSAISAGSGHTTYLKSDGAVLSAGYNSHGQLGDGTTTDRSNPVRVLRSLGGALSDIVEVSAGTSHTLFLASTGMVWAVGSNTHGQLGRGTNIDRLNPSIVLDANGTPLSGITAVSAGESHSVFLRTDGSVWATGLNNFGQLGDGTDSNRTFPVLVKTLGGTIFDNVRAIDAGGFHTTFIKNDGTLWSTGQNDNGQLGDGTNAIRNAPVQVSDSGGNPHDEVVAVSAGYKHTVFSKSDGTAWTMGWNFYGQLGNGANGSSADRSNPVQVKSSLGGYVSEIVDVSAGAYHTMMVKSDGTVWGVGRGSHGQHGVGSTQRTEAVQTEDPNGGTLYGVSKVEAGGSHTVFLKNDGTVLAAGSNTNGKLGDGTSGSDRKSPPVQVINTNGTAFTGVIGISAYQNSFYVKDDGTVWAAGNNGSGQLGDGTTANRSNPIQVLHDASSMAPFPQISIKAISANDYQTFYLKGDGTVWAVGSNGFGQLGDGTTTDRSNPVQVMDGSGNPLSGVVRISAGYYHTVYLKGDGTVMAAGFNYYGQLGDGTTTNKSNPVQVVDGSGNPMSGVVGIAAGQYHTVYLKEDGSVWAAGGNNYGQLGDGTTTQRTNPVQVVDGSGNSLSGVVGISAGPAYTVFLKSDGTIWAVGDNGAGQLGDGTTTNRSNPVQVVDGSGNPLSGVVGISAGNSHTVYLKGDGTIWAVGNNGAGRLGDGTTTNRSNPVQVVDGSGNPLSGVVGISAGGSHTVYLKGDGTIWAVGENGTGKLGDGTTIDRSNPVQVVAGLGNPLSGVVGIAAGGSHTVYSKGDGTVWAMGLNQAGQLGNGTISSFSKPVRGVDGSGKPLSGVVRISMGDDHTMYLKGDGTVWAAGWNFYGQLGDGTTTNRSNPVQVVDGSGNPLSGVVMGIAGRDHTVYLKGDGTVLAAGYNYYGRLGDGTTTNRSNPVQVVDGSGNPLSGVVGISAGGSHTVYSKGDGTVWAAGRNNYGQLGDGTTTNKSNPVQVVDGSGNPLSGVIGISAGYYHTVYLKGDGTVWAVGQNSKGQLGDGTTTDRSNPVQVMDGSGNSLSGVVGIAVGGSHTVHLKGEGTVWAAGWNNYGQLGDGTTSNRSNTIQVVDDLGNPLSGMIGISAGIYHTVYLKGDGTLWAVGYNNMGQLGDLTTTNRSNPVLAYHGVKQLADQSPAPNRAPVNLISTVSLTIAENQPIGTVVGEFNATDPDAGATLTYHLVSGAGDGNNSLFTLETNGTLKTATTFDYENNASTYSIRVQAKDEFNASVEGNFTVILTDVNESPANLSSTVSLTIAENQSIGTVVGEFNATDPDANASLTYSLVSGAGDANNLLFDLNASTGALTTKVVFDYENNATSYSIRVQAKDEYNATVEGSFSVSLTDRAESVNGRNLAGFTNAATLFGLSSASGYGNLYGEMAWGDYDGNGHLDLYITKNGSPNKLFHNHGTGLFSEVAAQVGLDHNGSGDCNWLDIDADGDLDLFQVKSDSIWLFRNDSGSFVEVAASLGLSSVGSYKASVWFDYDGDEDLDLFLSSKNSLNKLFQQQANGTFSEVASAAGVASGSSAMEVSVCDYNGDGWPDLIISGRNSSKRLMRNNGDGTFTNVASTAGVGTSKDSHGSDWADYDGDGDFDFHVANWYSANEHFRNNGDGTFTEFASSLGVATTSNITEASHGDYDGDGDQDLYLMNIGADRFYRNDGGVFGGDIRSSLGISGHNSHNGVPHWVDFDGDGDLDFYMLDGANKLYQNLLNPAPDTYLKIRLIRSNGGLGAPASTVRLLYDSNGSLAQLRHLKQAVARSPEGAYNLLFQGLTPGVGYRVEVTFPGGAKGYSGPVSPNGQTLTIRPNTVPSNLRVPEVVAYVDFSMWANKLNDPDGADDGDLVQDLSGNGYHGFWAGSTAANDTPVIATPTGVGVDTISTDGYVILRDNLSGIPAGWDGSSTTRTPYFNMESGKSYTFEAVLNWRSNISGRGGIMGLVGGNEWWIFSDNGNLAKCFDDGPNRRSNSTDISSLINNNDWHHVAVVFDRGLDEARLYVDHLLVEVDQSPEFAKMGAIGPVTADIMMGAYNSQDYRRFDGWQDRYRITKGTLNPSEFLKVNQLSARDSTNDLMIVENSPIGSEVGSFRATDPDAGATLSYYLVSGAGDGNNSLFTLETNGTLKTATTFDYETNASTFTIRVEARDEYNASVEGNFTVTLTDVYEAPPNTVPANLNSTTPLTIAENQPIGTVVGEFNATDPDVGASLTYYLVSGAGDGNNSLFTLESNGTLKTATTFDYETNASSYSIRVQAKDEFNATVEGNFTVVLTDVYEAPPNTFPSNLNTTTPLTIAENQPVGTVAGEFNATDLDDNATLTYHLVSGAGDGNNSLFTLETNGTLKTATTFDYETNASTYAIRVQAKDEFNATVEGNFTVTLTNLNEPVTGTVSVSGTPVVGQTLTASNTLADPDGLGAVTYQWYRDGVPIVLGGTLKDGVNGVDGLKSANKVILSSDGKHIYITAYHDNAVSWFEQNSSTGALIFRGMLKEGVGGVDGLNGPVSIALSMDGKHAYVVGRDDAISWYERNASTGALAYGGILEDGVNGVDGLDGANGVTLSANGNHVYVTASGDNSLSWFERNSNTGALSFLGVIKDGVGGVDGLALAQDLSLSSDGAYVYVVSSGDHSVSWFDRNVSSGYLVYGGILKDGVGGVDGLYGAKGVTLSADGKHAYVAGVSDHAVSWYDRNTSTGALSYGGVLKDGVSGVDGLQGANAVILSDDGNHAYVTGVSDDAVSWYERNASSGALAYGGILKDGVNGVDGLGGADSVTLSANGNHAYITGSGDDAVSWYDRNASTGTLVYMGVTKDGDGGVDGLEGATGINFSPDFLNAYVASGHEDALSWYDRNASTGALTYGGVLKDGVSGVDGLEGAYNLTISIDGDYAYVTAGTEDALSFYERNSSTGSLSYVGMLKDGVGGVDGLDGGGNIIASPDGKHLYLTGVEDDAVSWFEYNATTGGLTIGGSIKDGLNGVDGLEGAYAITLSTDGKHAYVTGLNDNSVSWYERNASTGTLSYIGMLEDDVGGVDGLRGAAVITLSPDNKHAYIAASGDNAVSWFERNASTGALTYLGILQDGLSGTDGLGGAGGLAVSFDGQYVYVSSAADHAVSWFERNSSTGALTYVGGLQDGVNGVDGLKEAWNTVLSPDGRFAYVTAKTDDSVSWFTRNPFTGALSYGSASDANYTLTQADLGKTITVVASYTDGGSFDHNMSSAGVPVNRAPNDLNSTGPLIVAENQPIGTVVGEFNATDPDAGTTFTYHLPGSVAGTSWNSLFTMESNGTLKTAALLDYETHFIYEQNVSTVPILVRVKDQYNATFDRNFSVTLTNLNDAPILSGGAASVQISVPESTVPVSFATTWDRTFGGTKKEYAKPFAAADGGYLLAGLSESNATGDKSENSRGDFDYWVVKVDRHGNKLWDKTYGGTGVDTISSVAQTADGGHLLAGTSKSNANGDKSEYGRGDTDFWVVKIDANGTKLWDKRFGGSGTEVLKEVLPAADGGFLLAGSSNSGANGDKSEMSRGVNDYWVLKIDANGTKLWDKRFGGSSGDWCKDIIATADGGYLLGGASESNATGDKSENSRGKKDFWVVKIDGNGTKLWDKTFGGSDEENLNSLIATSDGGYLLAGFSSSGATGEKSENSRGLVDYWVVKIDSTGNKLWDKRYGGLQKDYLENAIHVSGNGFLLSGNTESSSSNGDITEPAIGSADFWLVRIAGDGTKLWDRRLGGLGYEWSAHSLLTTDGGFLLSRNSHSGVSGDKSEARRGSADIWAIKLDANGNRNLYASDPEGTALTWSLNGGADAAKFVIDSNTGELTLAATDYEAPGDADANNSYEVTIQVTDATGLSSSVPVVITITDANDPSTGSVTVSGTPVVGETLTASNTLADPDGLGAITYQWYRDGVPITVGGTLKDGVNGVDGLASPRGLILSQDGKYAYVTAKSDNAVSWFERNASTGALTYLGMLKDGVGGVDGLASAHDLSLSPDGANVYVAANADNSIGWFERNATSGALTYGGMLKDGVGGVDGLNSARDVAISPDGRHAYVTAYQDHSVSWFERNATTGALTYGGVLKDGVGGADGLRQAYGVAVSADGLNVYVAGQNDNAVSWFERNATTGALTYGGMVKDGVNGVDGLNWSLNVLVSPDDRHFYATGIFDHAVSWYERNATGGGALHYGGVVKDGVNGVDGLLHARSLTLSSDGKHLYATGEADNALGWYERNATTGSLVYGGMLKDGVGGVDGLSSAQDVQVSPDGKYAYVVGEADSSISWFTRNPVTGALSYGLATDANYTLTAADAGAVLTVVASYTDGGSNNHNATSAGTQPVNSPPVFTVPASVSVSENQTSALDLNATDADGDALTYSIASGADSPKFSVNPASGELTFLNPPDFEANGSASGNNAYVVVVKVSDGTTEVNQAVTVNVTNLNEPATGSVTIVGHHRVGQTLTADVSTLADGDGLGALSYQWYRDGQPILLGGTLKDGVNGVDGLDDPPMHALSPDEKHVYVVSYLDDSISWFERNASTGALSYGGSSRDGLNGVSGLNGANSLFLSADGKHAYATSSSDCVVWFDRNASTGALVYRGKLQDGVNGVDGLNGARRVILSADGSHAYVTSVGEDSVSWFIRDASTGALSFGGLLKKDLNSINGLNGAHGVAIASSGDHVYVTGNQDDSVSWFSRDPNTGALAHVETFKNVLMNGAREIILSADQSHAYVSGYVDDSVSWFERNASTGALVPKGSLKDGIGGVDGLDGPMGMSLSADQKHFYVTSSTENSVSWFDRNTSTGALVYRGVLKDGSNDVDGLNEAHFVELSNDGNYAYVTAETDDSISWFTRDLVTGALSYGVASGSNYTLTQADLGKTITVVASYTDGGAFDHNVSSTGSPVVQPDNSAPTHLNLTAPLTIAENQPIGTVVGEFNATDPDAGATLIFSLVSGAGDGNNSLFTLETNGTLKTANVFDYETNAWSYSIRVRVMDAQNAFLEGNFSVALTDLDEVGPVITLLGQSEVVHETGAPYSDPGALWSDDSGESGTAVMSGVVNTNLPGSYPLTYSATDSAGNQAVTKTRTVKVVDTTLPVIRLVDAGPVKQLLDGGSRGDAITVDVQSVLKELGANPLGINFNYLRDDDSNRPVGSQSMSDALNELKSGFVRYPGGEMSDYHFFSSSPWDRAEPRVSGWYANEAKDLLNFDEYVEYLSRSRAKPFVVTSFDLEERTGVSKETYLEHAVEWVRYANVKKGYGVKYWEIGNENWHQHSIGRYVAKNGHSVSQYIAHSVREIALAMKAVDPSIRVGASVHNKNWAGTMSYVAGDALDFLTISNYVGPRLQSFEEYRSTQDKDLIDKVRDVGLGIAGSPHKDKLKIVVSEYNNGHWGTEWELRNDLGHAIVNFDMTGQLISHPKVEIANQWATRYLHDQDDAKLDASPGYYSLGKYNELLPSGRSLAIWGEFLKSNLVSTSGPAGIRSYATASPVNGGLTVFLINKTKATRYHDLLVTGSEWLDRARVYELTGNSERSLKPVWRERQPVGVYRGRAVTNLRLSPTSVTVIDFSPAKLPLSGKKGACFTLREVSKNGNDTPAVNFPKIASLAPSWNYSWGAKLWPEQPAGIEFIPMTWGTGASIEAFEKAVNETIRPQVQSGKVKRLLAFNEPDKKKQADMTVEAALKRWPLLESLGIPLCSPSCANAEGNTDESNQGVGGNWMNEFMQEVDRRGYRVDYVGVHWYGGVSAEAFKAKMERIYLKYGKRPLLITEFCPADWKAVERGYNKFSQESVLAFMKEVLPWMERTDWIAGYAWFPFGVDNLNGASSALFDANGNLTALGRYYRSVSPDLPSGDQSISVLASPLSSAPLGVKTKDLGVLRIPVGGSSLLPGVTAADSVDGNLTDLVLVSGKVEAEKPGFYRLVYQVRDQAGNEAERLSLEVEICEPSDFAPILNTLAKVESTNAGHRIGAEVVDAGVSGLVERGFLLSLKPDPRLGGAGVVRLTVESNASAFSVDASALQAGRKYYFRAYAVNAEGAGYGLEQTFVTPAGAGSPSWIDAQPGAAKGWWASPWLGTFYQSSNGWARHEKLGWIYPVKTKPGGVWLWSKGIGWLWTDTGLYPRLYADKEASWLYFYGSLEGKRLFYVYNGERWITTVAE